MKQSDDFLLPLAGNTFWFAYGTIGELVALMCVNSPIDTCTDSKAKVRVGRVIMYVHQYRADRLGKQQMQKNLEDVADWVRL